MNALAANVEGVRPPLVKEQQAVVMEQVRLVWDKLWYPPDEDTAGEFRHAHLSGLERSKTRERLLALDSVAAHRVLSVLDEAALHEVQIDRLQGGTP